MIGGNPNDGRPGRRPVALVTGASGGIGADLARELAKDGHDLVLAARSLAPMHALATELAGFGATSTVIGADLSLVGAAQELASELERRGIEIEVLINNAGLGAFGRFERSDPARTAEMLQVNIVALTELSRLLLPGMVARRRGQIMLVGSVASFQPGPRMAVYFATKAFVLSLGEALSYELRGTGVTVTTLCPGGTATRFFDVAGAHARSRTGLHGLMSSAEVAEQGYRALKAGRRVLVTGTVNRMLAILGRVAPRSIALPITAMLMPRDEMTGR
ncbi:MAG: SDR family oxidoreductase [Alphaproteobacteria bacterium]|nr:SDR family oxidoreductase [Alphaproteobacteria bacterium]